MINTNNHNQAVASLVLGIVAAASCFFGLGAIIGLICGIIGIVMANKAKNAGNTEGIRNVFYCVQIVILKSTIKRINFLYMRRWPNW